MFLCLSVSPSLCLSLFKPKPKPKKTQTNRKTKSAHSYYNNYGTLRAQNRTEFDDNRAQFSRKSPRRTRFCSTRIAERNTLFLLLHQTLRSPNRHPPTHIRIHVPRPDVETSRLSPVLAGIRVLLCSVFVIFPCLKLRSSYTGRASSIHVLKWDVTSNQGFGRDRLPIPSLKLRFSFSHYMLCPSFFLYTHFKKENVTWN
jgi:hypothetical protein